MQKYGKADFYLQTLAGCISNLEGGLPHVLREATAWVL